MNVVAFLLLVLATPVFGQLKWENPEQTVIAKPQDKVLVTKFRFTNVGTSPVKITDLRPSCGCTTAVLEKKEYAPGESGEIEAKFKFNGRVGHQEKWIVVTTDWVPPATDRSAFSRSTFPKRLPSCRKSFSGASAIN